MNTVSGIAALIACTGIASAQVIDGASFDTDYGAAVWTQNIGTAFGNSTDPGALNSSGSEIDAVFFSLSGTTLSVGVAGNLETNFNKLNLALDFRSGGQNTLNGLPNLGNLDGLKFDAGFGADVVLSYTNGNPPQSGTGSGNFEHYLDGANIGGGGGFLAGGEKGVIGAISTTLDGASVVFDSDHSNTGGVNTLGSPFDSDPGTVYTGVEFSIDLGALGWDGTSAVRLAGWVNASNNDFLSNQVIGGLPDGFDNLGGPGGVDFSSIAGAQFVTVPAPASVALLGLGGLAAVRRRR